MLSPEQRVEAIRAALEKALHPSQLVIDDVSYKHVGHAGAKSGKGHFDVEITSEAFKGCLPLQRHRMVYEALGSLMDTDIHALSIKASIP